MEKSKCTCKKVSKEGFEPAIWHRSSDCPCHTPSSPDTTPKVVPQREDFEIRYCDKCIQSTNHLKGICQKCLPPQTESEKTYCDKCDNSHTQGDCYTQLKKDNLPPQNRKCKEDGVEIDCECNKLLHLTEEVEDWEEYSFEGENPEKCDMICDHNIYWCGDIYACNNCGLRFIPAKWANKKLSSNTERVKREERQFILNVLDGIDIADREIGGFGGGTSAIRHALKSRI